MILRESPPTNIPNLVKLCVKLGYPITIEGMTLRMSEMLLQLNSKSIVAEANHQVIGLIGMIKSLS